jgi:ribose transport system ATP-binding protein
VTATDRSGERLVARGISKSFGAMRALSEVSLTVRPGSVHAVLGENGAGKSTLMKILAGAVAPDAGVLELDGASYAPEDPKAARRRGVAIVYQELSVCPHLSVAENIALGAEPARYGWISRRIVEARARTALAALGVDPAVLPLDRLVGELSAAEQQIVEIARALSLDDCRLLIVDEPTSSLGTGDVSRLFTALAALRERGLAIVYISHFLDEVRRIGDDYTVLRDGRFVATGRVADVTNDELVVAMAGHAVEHAARTPRAAGERLLTVTELGGAVLPKSATLELGRGEVLGVAGLVGSGRTELLRAIFGLEEVVRGEVRVGAFAGRASPLGRLAQGVGLLSEDRAREGLALALSVEENLTLSKLEPLRRRGLLSPLRAHALAAQLIDRLGIRTEGPQQRVSELSGGNQQKVALGRLLHHDVDVLLLDEPTRGIDVRSRAEVHRLIDELCAHGKAVLMVSSHLEELLAVCDRVQVMRRGVLGVSQAVAGLSERELLKEATGA